MIGLWLCTLCCMQVCGFEIFPCCHNDITCRKLMLHFVWHDIWPLYLQFASNAAVNTSPCSSSSPKYVVVLQLHHARLAILANSWQQSGPVLVRTMLTPSYPSSCLLLFLIASMIGLSGMAENSNPLVSRRSPTGDAADPPSMKIFHVFSFRCRWVVTKVF